MRFTQQLSCQDTFGVSYGLSVQSLINYLSALLVRMSLLNCNETRRAHRNQVGVNYIICLL